MHDDSSVYARPCRHQLELAQAQGEASAARRQLAHVQVLYAALGALLVAYVLCIDMADWLGQQRERQLLEREESLLTEHRTLLSVMERMKVRAFVAATPTVNLLG